jgi:hypothetical protein
MKAILILFVIINFLSLSIFPQVNFNPHTITTNAFGASSVYAIDLDGDNDIDVLSASIHDDKIAWYENDGSENFTTHVITTMAIVAIDVLAIDLDRDGDIDVLSASFGDNKLAWYENDGNENFTEHIITFAAIHTYSVYAIDVDGDDDIDVLSASFGDNKLAWYENDGNENFTAHIITNSADGAVSVYAIDVDNDGDMDVLSASWSDNIIAWYENLIISDVESISSEIPIEYALSQNYPNPFNPLTTIRFSIAEESNVSITVSNSLGEEIETFLNERMNAGSYEISFDADLLPSGIYFYTLTARNFIETKKMILLK